MANLDPKQLALLSPAGFAWYASGGKWVCPAHLALINEKLMGVASGRIKRLIVTLPPRHGKSELISKYFPAWYLGMYPERRVILSSYESSFASSWGRKARDLLIDNQDLFDISIDQKSSAVQDWNIIKRGGGMNTAGVGSPLTGRGFFVGVIDDPVKNAEEAMSETIREKVKDWYKSTFYTRQEPNAAIVIMMTRWHDDDLVGWLLEEQKKGGDVWEVVNLPAIAQEGDLIGRKAGEALWPERFPINELKRIKKAVGTFWFESMYQQNPVPSEGGIIKRGWWKYYSEAPDRKAVKRYIWAWDTAVKVGQGNDYSVGIYLGETENGYYVLDLVRERMEYPDLKRAIVAKFHGSRASAVVIEDKSSGQQVIQELTRGERLPIIACEPVTDKVTRAHLVTPLIEAGIVYIPERAPWVGSFLDECLKFPSGTHDDQVDALVYGLDYLKNHRVRGVHTIMTGAGRESSNF